MVPSGTRRRGPAAWWRRGRRALAVAGAAVLAEICLSARRAVAATPALAGGGGVPGINVNPGWRDMPGKEKIEMFLDVASQVGLACSLASVLIGAAMLGIGRATGNGQASSRGLTMVFGGGGGAVLIPLAPALIGWVSK
ncbi:hypothetical protein I6A84_04560 [Frankia sp. CNm7]|uniref:Uncharacterized protein n=1 Tax=Frankia nepalensis TaxID=1836974 RepID=A0A937R9K2_9ACTN|nr:hypothetical protein [Frankia nepalensis]MBL7498724.1 hypothetical protein [Frankia nepalensis]MBL7508411.1 hypothetical protein [Frankia nepalensis]MBL7517411.1 hypothetical protein [Frankia nepalensis]MBL7626242.1 hypothetical protein [Frankia nepalensis]